MQTTQTPALPTPTLKPLDNNEIWLSIRSDLRKWAQKRWIEHDDVLQSAFVLFLKHNDTKIRERGEYIRLGQLCCKSAARQLGYGFWARKDVQAREFIAIEDIHERVEFNLTKRFAADVVESLMSSSVADEIKIAVQQILGGRTVADSAREVGWSQQRLVQHLRNFGKTMQGGSYA